MTASKVTLTLPAELIAAVDRYVDAHRGATRSGLCARALSTWLQQVQEEEIERYYTSMTDEERAEDEAWANLAAHQPAQHWE